MLPRKLIFSSKNSVISCRVKVGEGIGKFEEESKDSVGGTRGEGDE